MAGTSESITKIIKPLLNIIKGTTDILGIAVSIIEVLDPHNNAIDELKRTINTNLENLEVLQRK